jgi:hypothetical protein
MQIYSRVRPYILLLALLPLTGCLFRTRTVDKAISTNKLKDASLDQLIETINKSAANLKTLNAQVEIDSSVGGLKKGKITDNPEITGYVLLQKPEMIRVIGLVPVVRTRAFDMASDGRSFKLSIPPKNKFVIGSNQPVRISSNPLENVRPQHILDALLLKEIDPKKGDIAALEEGVEIVKDPKTHKDAEQGDYVVLVLSKDNQGYYLSRKIVFSRETLQPERQLIYDRKGQLVTDARYGTFKDYNGTQFPSRIEIERPVEEYSITLNIDKLTANEPIKPEQFELTQPAGSQFVNLDNKSTAENQAPSTEAPKKPH